jgi:hypothetical protein
VAILIRPSQYPFPRASATRWLAWILGLCFLPNLATPSLAQAADEYHVKALFLYNFAKFVDWPQQMQAGPICIGVFGEDPFGGELDQTVAGKTVNGRGFVIKRLKRQEDAKACHIVFVSGSEKKRTRAILEGLENCSVLTVGEVPGFAPNGGIINFEIVDSKVRFEVNIDAAERTGLKLSSKLLSLAKIVKDGRP